jgi:hypothetical protein
MKDTDVKMKDGRTFCGPMWLWRPKEGWFQLAGDYRGPDQIFLRVEDVDCLAQAREDGWDGT